MFATGNIQKHCFKFKTLSCLIQSNPYYKNVALLKEVSPMLVSSNVIQPSTLFCDDNPSLFKRLSHPFSGWSRAMSTSRRGSSMSTSRRGSSMSTSRRGSSIRSKVERRLQKESGKTQREIRRAKKIKKKLMTDEERLIYNLKRAKKKVALLLQKLKKYELPELPASLHDPELFTPEQIQAYKKIGFRNKNYVPVGVRGVFGGVVQNMHLHWKFHETVQVCCGNFPKEKIKEMATMLARLSGGIVINIHNVKTIIMFRGRNYRQPKSLIPFNTLTKRKALFKARFEQALESQKLNIKKIEQQLRRMGVNPEDPVAMASIQRVASTFFNAIDQKEGSPYVFRGDKELVGEPKRNIEHSEPPDDSDQEELDNFIAEIEDAADKEWAEEEAAENEEAGKIRYWNREEFGGRFRRSENLRNDDPDDIRGWKDKHGKRRFTGSDDEDNGYPDVDDEWDSNNVQEANDLESDADEARKQFTRPRRERGEQEKVVRANSNKGWKRNAEANLNRKMAEEDSESENMFSDLENAMWQSDSEEEHDIRASGADASPNYISDSDEEDGSVEDVRKTHANTHSKRNAEANFRGKMAEKDSGSEDLSSESEVEMLESDLDEDSRTSMGGRYNYISGGEEYYHQPKDEKSEVNHRPQKSLKQMDETWDSD